MNAESSLPLPQEKAEPLSPIVRGGGRLWTLVLLLAWPVLVQQFFVLLVQLSDRFLAGRFQTISVEEKIEAGRLRFAAAGDVAGSLAAGQGLSGIPAAAVHWRYSETILTRQAAFLAAQTTASYFSWFLSSYTVLVTVGATALVARNIGAGDRSAAIAFTHQALLLATGLGAIGSLSGLWFIGDFVRLLRLEGEAATYAADYLRPLFALFAFQMIEMGGIACLIGAGDTKSGLWVTAGVAVINIPLSWVLCLGWGPVPKLGFTGIALGTALAHVCGAAAVVGLLAAGRFGLQLGWRFLRPDWAKLRRLLRVSVPAGIDSMSVVVCQFWFLSIVNRLGTVAGSAHGIAINWEALGYLSGMAFGTAAMTLVGQNLGAGRPDRASRSGWVAFAIGCLVMSVMGAIFFTFAEPMFLLFCPYPEQSAIVVEGIPVLRLIAFAMPPLASAIIFTHALRGAGDTAVPVLITWTGFLLVRIPLAYYLALDAIEWGDVSIRGVGMGLYGAWLAMFADLLLRGIMLTIRFARGRWQHVRV